LLYRQLAGGSDYARTFTLLAPHDFAGLVRTASIVAGSFFGNAAPGMLFGGWFNAFAPQPLTLLNLTLGLVVTSLVIGGAVAGMLRPAQGRSGLGDAYLLVTIVLAVAYSFGFAWYAENFMQRALIPVLPFAALAFVRALWLLLGGLQERGREALIACVVLFGVASNVFGAMLTLILLFVPPAHARSYMEVYAAIERLTPPDTVLMGQEGHQITLYTNRLCETIPTFAGGVGALPAEATPRQLILTMHKRHVRYLVGTPDYQWGERHDRSIALVNELIAGAPGLLKEVHMGQRRNFALFAVDPVELEKLAALARATR
jgi:hypothetical protein